MKLSYLVEQLEKIKSEHGDLDVHIVMDKYISTPVTVSVESWREDTKSVVIQDD